MLKTGLMVLSLSKIRSFTMHATDGKRGTILDLYPGVNDWRIRYLLVNLGDWLREQPVYILPRSADSVDFEPERIDATIEKSHRKEPRPESRKWFFRFHDHHGLPISRRFIETISWHYGEVRVSLTPNQANSSPEYQEGTLPTYEEMEELEHKEGRQMDSNLSGR